MISTGVRKAACPMRVLRVTMWTVIALLGAFLALNPFVNGVQEAATQLRVGTAAKNAALARAQGGVTEQDRVGDLNAVPIRRETPPFQTLLFESRSVQLGACGGLLSIMIIAEAARRHAYRKASDRARRPPGTSLSTPATHADPIHGGATRTRPTGAPVMANIDRVETLGSVGLLAHLAEDQTFVATEQPRKRRVAAGR
jgi:hypothetical protein